MNSAYVCDPSTGSGLGMMTPDRPSMATKRYSGEVVRLALLAGDRATISDAEFADCEVYGPAVLAGVERTSIESCGWEGHPDSIIWVLNQPSVTGGVRLVNCRFVGCRFHNVGIVG